MKSALCKLLHPVKDMICTRIILLYYKYNTVRILCQDSRIGQDPAGALSRIT